MTVAEVSAVGLPAVYVPLPIGNGEQKLNSRDVVAAGGGVSGLPVVNGFADDRIKIRIDGMELTLDGRTAIGALKQHRAW